LFNESKERDIKAYFERHTGNTENKQAMHRTMVGSKFMGNTPRCVEAQQKGNIAITEGDTGQNITQWGRN